MLNAYFKTCQNTYTELNYTRTVKYLSTFIPAIKKKTNKKG